MPTSWIFYFLLVSPWGFVYIYCLYCSLSRNYYLGTSHLSGINRWSVQHTCRERHGLKWIANWLYWIQINVIYVESNYCGCQMVRWNQSRHRSRGNHCHRYNQDITSNRPNKSNNRFVQLKRTLTNINTAIAMSKTTPSSNNPPIHEPHCVCHWFDQIIVGNKLLRVGCPYNVIFVVTKSMDGYRATWRH